MYKVYLLYFFSLFVTTAIHSTELITPHFERLRNVEGHVYSVYQDTDGFLWIGSKTGVARYDGAKFIHFDSRDNALPLTNDNIQTITEDSQGRLWLGSRDGLNVLNKDRTEIRHIYGENDGKSLSHSEIRKVIEDKINGGFWIATYGGGVNYFNESTGLYTYFKHDPNNMFSIPGDYINDIWLDTRGRLWVACEVGGVAWYNDVTKQFIRVSLQNNNGVEYTASAILEDKQGNIWVGTWIKGLYRYNENSKELESIIRSSRLDDPKNTIRRLINDSDTHIWVATLGGLMKLNLETLEVNLYQNENNKGGSIASNKIWSIYKDEESILWVGTLDKGLCKWDPKAHKFHLYEPYLSTVYDLKNDNVSALYYDKHSKILWIATMNNQIHLLDIEKKRYLDNQILKQLDGHGVTSICKDETGRFWLTSAYGISVYDSSTKQLKMYPKEIIKMESQEIGGVYSCSFGASGNLYFGAWGAGLVVLPSHKINKPNLTSDDFIHLSIANSKLESNVIWNVLSDGKGDIWVDCKRGVYLYNEHKKKITKFSDQSLRLCKTIDGKIYGINPIGQLYKLSKESGLVLMKDFKEDDLRLE